MAKVSEVIDTEFLAYAVEVAKAINEKQLSMSSVSYGTYYIGEVTFEFEGDVVPNISLTVDETGDIGVRFTSDTKYADVEVLDDDDKEDE